MALGVLHWFCGSIYPLVDFGILPLGSADYWFVSWARLDLFVDDGSLQHLTALGKSQKDIDYC